VARDVECSVAHNDVRAAPAQQLKQPERIDALGIAQMEEGRRLPRRYDASKASVRLAHIRILQERMPLRQ